MKATRDNQLTDILEMSLAGSVSEDVNTGDYTCKSNLTRVFAITDAEFKDKNTESTDGIKIAAGSVEYFRTEVDEVIEVINGEINFTACN